MLEASVDIRVRYAETDKMGYVYYGNYSTYLEVARVEMLRDLGIVYKDLEDEDILLPLLDFSIKYIRPGKYDDILTVKTKIEKKPATRLYFTYEIYNQEETLITKAETTLVFVNAKTGRPMLPPKSVVELGEKYF
jgi:acyl-CoA thioester hydrolase